MRAGPAAARTFMFSDIEGSTKLWHDHPNEMQSVISRHNELAKRLVEQNDGQVFKTTGDGALAAFSTAKDALNAAIQFQLETMAFDWGIPEPPNIRMAIHSGEAQEVDGDFFGLTVHRCDRLLKLAHGGQILVSWAAKELLD